MIKRNVSIYEFESFKMSQCFFRIHYWDIEHRRQMRDQEDNIDLGKRVFDKNQDRKLSACLGQTCCSYIIVFLSQFVVILLNIFGCFWRIHFLKSCDESTVGVEILFTAAGYISPSPRLRTCYFKINRVVISLVGPSKMGKSHLFFKWPKLGTFQPNIDKTHFLYQHSQSLYHVKQKRLIFSSLFKMYTLNL